MATEKNVGMDVEIQDTTWNWLVETEPIFGKAQARYQELYQPHETIRCSPGTVDSKVHWKFKEQLKASLGPAFVALVDGGHVWGPEGTVITPDNKLLADVARALHRNPKDHPIFHETSIPPPLDFNGTAVVITARGGGSNFFHWMFDVLPRIYLLRSSKFASNRIDTFIVNSMQFNFQIQTLMQLSIPMNMIIQSEQVPHIRCQHLIVPSLTRLEGNIPAWVCEFVRNTFLLNGIKKPKQPEFLYVTRQSATRRRVANENEVRSYLEKKGFVTIVSETLSVTDQASVFANARCVIGPHGAGLTNIVFCNPGATIIEFFSPNCVRPAYWALSNIIGLNYYYLLGEGKPPPDGVDPNLGREDIIVNLDRLDELMKLAKVIP